MRTQIAHVPVRKKHAPLSLYLEMKDLEVQHELTVVATLSFWHRLAGLESTMRICTCRRRGTCL